MSSSGFYQGRSDVANGFEGNNRACVIQRCFTPAEYQCTICSKRYCDEHYRVHFHFDDDSNVDFK